MTHQFGPHNELIDAFLQTGNERQKHIFMNGMVIFFFTFKNEDNLIQIVEKKNLKWH